MTGVSVPGLTPVFRRGENIPGALLIAPEIGRRTENDASKYFELYITPFFRNAASLAFLSPRRLDSTSSVC